MVTEFRKSIKHNVDMNLSGIVLMPKRERLLTCMLLSVSETIKKDNQILPVAIAKSVNSGKNGEFNFIIKQVVLLIESVVVNSAGIHIKWDATSSVYAGCTLDVQFCRHDIILYTREGTEIGTGEIKSPSASGSSVDIDRCRIAESLKKQLHKRMVLARSPKELATFGILIYGAHMAMVLPKPFILNTLNDIFDDVEDLTIFDHSFVKFRKFNKYSFLNH